MEEGSDSVLSAVTCQNSFPNLEDLFSDMNIIVSDPPLIDIIIQYIYEAFLVDDGNKNDALAAIEDAIFSSVLNETPWMMNNEPNPESDCTELLATLLNLSITNIITNTNSNRLLTTNDDDWSHFLGWKNQPSDSFQEGATCVNKKVVEGSTCYRIEGKITAQVPIDSNLSPAAIQTQVMSNIKSSVDNGDFISTEVLSMQFLGQTFDGNIGFTSGPFFPTAAPVNEDVDELLSIFGISAICALSAALILIMGVFGNQHRRRSKERSFGEIQDDAINLGNLKSDDLETPTARNVFTESSPDGIEIVDLNAGFGGGGAGAAPVGDTNTVNSASTGRTGFNFGSFMDSLRGKDDLSYASGPSQHGDGRSLADDSALSVETEDYGNTTFVPNSKPYSPNKFQNEL